MLSLGSESDAMNAIIIHIGLLKIDPESKAVYDEKQDFDKLPSWNDCYFILSLAANFLKAKQQRLNRSTVVKEVLSLNLNVLVCDWLR